MVLYSNQVPMPKNGWVSQPLVSISRWEGADDGPTFFPVSLSRELCGYRVWQWTVNLEDQGQLFQLDLSSKTSLIRTRLTFAFKTIVSSSISLYCLEAGRTVLISCPILFYQTPDLDAVVRLSDHNPVYRSFGRTFGIKDHDHHDLHESLPLA